MAVQIAHFRRIRGVPEADLGDVQDGLPTALMPGIGECLMQTGHRLQVESLRRL